MATQARYGVFVSFYLLSAFYPLDSKISICLPTAHMLLLPPTVPREREGQIEIDEKIDGERGQEREKITSGTLKEETVVENQR